MFSKQADTWCKIYIFTIGLRSILYIFTLIYIHHYIVHILNMTHIRCKKTKRDHQIIY